MISAVRMRGRSLSLPITMEFVPPERRAESAPCHHIPLTRSGDSAESIQLWTCPEEFEDIVKNWLRDMIKRLEEENSTAP